MRRPHQPEGLTTDQAIRDLKFRGALIAIMLSSAVCASGGVNEAIDSVQESFEKVIYGDK